MMIYYDDHISCKNDSSIKKLYSDLLTRKKFYKISLKIFIKQRFTFRKFNSLFVLKISNKMKHSEGLFL